MAGSAAIVNLGRKVEPVVGLSAINANANGGVIPPTSVRYHRLKGKCVAVNYTGAGALATKKITGNGNNDCTTTLTIVNGQVTAAAVTAGGTAYVTGDTIQPVDPTGKGCVLTVTANAGVVTALAVTNGGTQSAIDPVNFFDSFLMKVKNAPFRAVSLDSMKRLLNARGIYPALGELLIQFSEFDRNFLRINDANSWDLLNGEKFELIWKIKAGLVNPGFSLFYEYDLTPNVINGKNGQPQRFRNPVKYRETTVNLNAGLNTFNRETLNTGGEPILRMWFVGSVPGNITDIEVKADSDIKVHSSVPELNELYEKAKFTFGRSDFLNFNYPSSNTLKGQYNAPAYFDTAFIADVDGRLNEALVYSKLDVALTSAVQQTCTVLVETAPGDYI